MHAPTRTDPTLAPLSLTGERLRADPAPLWKEWTLTNALGGYAMGSALGTPTRRYHGLLVSAERPPVERALALTQIHETLILSEGATRERRLCLTPLHFTTSDDRPEDLPELVEFEIGTDCRWRYRVTSPDLPDVEVTKTLHLFRERNACAVEYAVGGEGVPWRLELRPLLALRGFHEVTDPEKFEGRFLTRHRPGGVVVNAGRRGVHLTIRGARPSHAPERWRNLHYAWEARRGLEHREDLFCPGAIHSAGDGSVRHTITCVASDDGATLPPIEDDRAAQIERLTPLVRTLDARLPADTPAADRESLRRLAVAGDQFVVRRGVRAEGVSVIAGYPWFSDWGRDAMISLPGLFLATGRFDEALGVLKTFAGAQRRGLIPNRFDDYGGENHYNTVDGSLWFVHACAAYLHATGDRAGFDDLAPACLGVIRAYREGTDYDIAMDPADGLIRAGNEHTQLTWMDAQRGGVTFTPRHGKAVEINALWFNALTLLAEALPGHEACAGLGELARRAGDSFVRAFVSPGDGLIDCLTPTGEGWEADRSVRPNQIFAASLPRSPLSAEQRRELVRIVRERLLTPVGLRTLDPGDPAYRGRYEGDLMARDAAYHNGTVWPWLLGAYAEAVMRADAFSEASRAEAGEALRPLIRWLTSGWSPGQLPEIFDGDDSPDTPREPDGCPAQAWSVAETLRVWLMSLGAPGSPGLTP
ncbi:MAG: amylo-alpha-1,6-glucosidase [Phycisphaerales bacterium JB059]